MADSGLDVLATDPVGNVVAHLPGSGDGAPPFADTRPLVVSAHLDTVFPAGTDTTVSREGGLLRAPGISDDARGLGPVVASGVEVPREAGEVAARDLDPDPVAGGGAPRAQTDTQTSRPRMSNSK